MENNRFKLILLIGLLSVTALSQELKEYTIYNDLYILGNTRISFDDFKLFVERKYPFIAEPFIRSMTRQAIAQYLKEKLKISGYNQDPSQFDQNTEDIVLFLSHKAAKDFVMREDMFEFTFDQIKELFFEQNKANPKLLESNHYKQPQTQNSNKLLDYTNSILVTMQNYMIDKIIENKLTWQNKENITEERELIQLRNERAGLEPMAFFLFKLTYENDRRYAFERIETWGDFDEFLPISPLELE
eukprot:403342669